MWLAAALILIPFAPFLGRKTGSNEQSTTFRIFAALAVLVFPVIENLPLLEQAIVYSFAKLKFALPLSVCMGLLASRFWQNRVARGFAVAVCLAAAITNIWAYHYVYVQPLG